MILVNILIVGNGFDLAHGLPTAYADFLKAKAFDEKLRDNKWMKYFLSMKNDADGIGKTWIDFEGEIEKWSKYDIICGKIANDNTNLVITAYIDGIYGNIMSDTADRIAIGFLEPENLKDQICIRTAKALRCLSFIECQEVTI